MRTEPAAVDVWEASPLRWEDEASHTEEIIDCVFPGNPYLCAGWSAWSFKTRRRSAWRGLLSELPLIVPNPAIAQAGLTKEGKESQHTLQATAHRIYLVLEWDFVQTDRTGQPTIWAPVIRGREADHIMLLDACAAVSAYLATLLPTWVLFLYSGGKSGHSWFNVRAVCLLLNNALSLLKLYAWVLTLSCGVAPNSSVSLTDECPVIHAIHFVSTYSGFECTGAAAWWPVLH